MGRELFGFTGQDAAVRGLKSQSRKAISWSLSAPNDPWIIPIILYPRSMGESLPSFGTVMDVDGDILRIWVSGVTELDGTRIPIPPSAPSWLLEKGRDFVVSGDLRSLETATYSLHKVDAAAGGGEA